MTAYRLVVAGLSMAAIAVVAFYWAFAARPVVAPAAQPTPAPVATPSPAPEPTAAPVASPSPKVAPKPPTTGVH